MKVAINRCYGGFRLSDKAIEMCIEKGMSVSDNWEDRNVDFIKETGKRNFGYKYYAINDYDLGFRTNPIVIEVVELLGKEANTDVSEIEIIEIPFDSTNGWEITEYDGIERIEEFHRSW